MTAPTKPTRPGSVQINPTNQPGTTWYLFDASIVPNVPMGTVHADAGEDALAIAQKHWPDHTGCIGVVSTAVFAKEQDRAARSADRHVKYIAYHEAAHAVISHRLGYQVESITTRARFCAFDLATGMCSHLPGYTHVSGVPTEEELQQPEHRAEAEDYVISALVGPITEAFFRGRRVCWAESEDLRAIRALVERHADGCVDRYLAWLQQRTEVRYLSPAVTDIVAVAKMLVRRREVTGIEFRRFLRKRASDDQRRQRQWDAEHAHAHRVAAMA